MCSLQDVLIPFCTDVRFDEDTLFIIFEEDFRFAPDLGDPAWTHNKRVDTSMTMPSTSQPSPPPAEQASSSSSAAASSHNKIPREHKVEPTAHQEPSSRKMKAGVGDYKVLNKPSAADWKKPSVFLRDLVAYATLAHRQKRGDFIFCGWQPHGAGEADSCKNKNNYRSGLMLTMVSQTGFWELETQWRVHPKLTTPAHVDLCLPFFSAMRRFLGRATSTRPWEGIMPTSVGVSKPTTTSRGFRFGWRTSLAPGRGSRTTGRIPLDRGGFALSRRMPRSIGCARLMWTFQTMQSSGLPPMIDWSLGMQNQLAAGVACSGIPTPRRCQSEPSESCEWGDNCECGTSSVTSSLPVKAV